MGHNGQSAVEKRLPHLFILECDRLGRILWMSQEARTRLGGGEKVTAISTCAARPARFSRVFENSRRVWIGVQTEDPAFPQSASDLAGLERSFARLQFRLAEAERALFQRRRRSRAVGRTLRQIEMERQRLGRELHTEVGQMLAAMRLQVDTLEALLPAAPAPVRQAIDRTLRLNAEAMERVRNISHRLHPPEWQRLGIETAVRQLWELSGIPERFEASLRIDALPEQPALAAKTLIYRAAQEAFSNIAQHARPKRVEVILEARGAYVSLTVRDDGAGFDTEALFAAPPDVGRGIGLRSIREQVADLGGRFELASGRTGTTLEVLAPFVPVAR